MAGEPTRDVTTIAPEALSFDNDTLLGVKAGKLTRFPAASIASVAAVAQRPSFAQLGSDVPNEGADIVANAVRRVGSSLALAALPTPIRKTVVVAEGYAVAGDAGPAKAFLWVPASTLPHDGICVIQPNSAPANGRWEWRGIVDPRWAGAIADGVTDCATAFIAVSAVTRGYKLPWVVPAGDFLVNANQVLQFTTGVNCMGQILIPKLNKICRIEFIRDSAGAVLDTSAWGALNRGDIALGATNAVGKTVYLSSTQILIERIGGTPYLRQEMIRIHGPLGRSTTPLVCTYDDKSQLTATAYEPCLPIIVNDLQVVRIGPDGPGETFIGLIFNERDNAVFNSHGTLNANPLEPMPIGIIARTCVDVILNSPRGTGLNYAGFGYGILASVTLGLTINDANFGDCRHGFSGRHNVDVRINGGTWGNVIDEHWGDRMVIIAPRIVAEQGAACIQYAGNDITIVNPVCAGGRTLFAIRLDTPSLGGRVSIIRPSWTTKGESGLTWLFGFTSTVMPNAAAMAIFTQPLLLPELVEIESPSIESDAVLVYLAYLGTLQKAHAGWGTIAVDGIAQRKGAFDLIGVFGTKDSTYQVSRALRVEMCGPIKFTATDRPVYLNDADNVPTRGASMLLYGVEGGSPRFSAYSMDKAQIIGGSIHSITNDKGAATYANQRYTLADVEMQGGAINLLSNIAFQQCVFNGVYSNLPSLATGTYIGCVKTATGNIGSITNITDNVVAPFSTPSPSKTYDPPSLATGTSTSTTVAAVGAALGNIASASFSLDLQGLQISAYVSAPDVITVVLVNLTGGTIDLASGILRVRFNK